MLCKVLGLPLVQKPLMQVLTTYVKQWDFFCSRARKVRFPENDRER